MAGQIVILALDDFLQATASPTTSHEDGSGGNDYAMWWRRAHTVPGATWHLTIIADGTRSGPAVVDDYGTLVRAEVQR